MFFDLDTNVAMTRRVISYVDDHLSDPAEQHTHWIHGLWSLHGR